MVSDGVIEDEARLPTSDYKLPIHSCLKALLQYSVLQYGARRTDEPQRDINAKFWL